MVSGVCVLSRPHTMLSAELRSINLSDTIDKEDLRPFYMARVRQTIDVPECLGDPHKPFLHAAPPQS